MTTQDSEHWLRKLSGIIAIEENNEAARCKVVADAFVQEVVKELNDEKSETSQGIKRRTKNGKYHMNLVWGVEGSLDYSWRVWTWNGMANNKCLVWYEKEIHTALNEKYNKLGFRFGDRGGWFRPSSSFQIYCKWNKV